MQNLHVKCVKQKGKEMQSTEYAKSVEEKRQAMEKRFEKTDKDYIKKFEKS